MPVARLVLQFVLGIALTFALQRWDRRRLSDEQRERAWNGATWFVSLWWFGPLSMFGWGWVTRRAIGLVYAAICVIGLFGMLWAADLLFAWIFDLPLDLDEDVFR